MSHDGEPGEEALWEMPQGDWWKPTTIAEVIQNQLFAEKKLEEETRKRLRLEGILNKAILRNRWLRECHRAGLDINRLARATALYEPVIDWGGIRPEDVNEIIEMMACTPLETWGGPCWCRSCITLNTRIPDHEYTEEDRDAVIYYLANLFSMPTPESLGKKCEAPAGTEPDTGVYDDPFNDD